MKRKHPISSDLSEPSNSRGNNGSKVVDEEVQASGGVRMRNVRRSGTVWLTLFVLITYSSWAVYKHQFQNLPVPLGAEQAGKKGFSEAEAMKHVKALTELGPHPVSSDALDRGLQYVLAAAEKIKKTAHSDVDVHVDFFQAKTGANSGMFKGKTAVYSDISHIVLRILPKYETEAGENAILVSSHIDTVFATEGAGDCSSCIAVMLELARCVSQWAHGFKNSVIFLFNTGEEEGLYGAHSFITQHPWSPTIRLAIDLEAMGIGGKSSIFQAGPDPWAIENFASAAKYPSGQILAQDVFASGVINSATDFQVYKEVGGLSGLDFAYVDNTAVYHTKNDKLELLKQGSFQHLGENMLGFLLRFASSSNLPKNKPFDEQEKSNPDSAIYFDILGKYMIVYRQSFAKMLHYSVIMQSLLIWATSLFMGGYTAAILLGLSCLSIILLWIFSISFSVLVALTLPLISSSPVPYVSSPWLVIGLFASPSLLGAITGQHLAYIILQKYLLNEYSKRKQHSPDTRAYLVKLEAERWLFKGGSIQWLVLLMLGTYYKIGSSYLALVWLVSPAFAYGMLEATLTPARLPKPLKLATLLIGLAVPILISSGIFIRLAGTMIGMVVRWDRNPGGTSEWMGSAVVAVVVSVFICLSLVYLLSYVHLSDAMASIVTALCVLIGLSLALVSSGVIPAFTGDTARAVHVVHVVDTTSRSGETQNPSSFVSLFSSTPGNLKREVEQIKEGFVCDRDKVIDFASFEVKYGCVTHDDVGAGWSEADVPIMQVTSDPKDERTTRVSIDTRGSTRWSLAINFEEVEDFTFEVESEEVATRGDKISKDGWHVIQYSGGKNAPTRFVLALFRARNSTEQSRETAKQREDGHHPLLKLRTDFNRVTPKVERILEKLPPWCSLFGKSTAPFNLAFLADLPV